jgi:peptidylprolyl isomerase
MSKNIMPFLIVLAVLVVGFGGILYLSNQKTPDQNAINFNPTSNPIVSPTSYPNSAPTAIPTSAIITQQPNQESSTNGANMDNYQTLTGGLKVLDETMGTGAEVKSGDTVTVNYLGTLQSGTKFDSSYDRNTPFTTQIGVGQVIKGWDEGIIGMKVGGKRKLVVPPDLGYGNQPAGSIPPGSTLIFEVELLNIK